VSIIYLLHVARVVERGDRTVRAVEVGLLSQAQHAGDGPYGSAKFCSRECVGYQDVRAWRFLLTLTLSSRGERELDGPVRR